MEPVEQFGRSLIRVLIGPSIGPFAKRGLDEALGFSIGVASENSVAFVTNRGTSTSCVPMMQPAKDWVRDNVSKTLNGPSGMIFGRHMSNSEHCALQLETSRVNCKIRRLSLDKRSS